MDTESAARRAGVLDLHGLAQGLHPKLVDYLGDARDHMQPVPARRPP